MNKIWSIACAAVIALSVGTEASAAMYQNRDREPRGQHGDDRNDRGKRGGGSWGNEDRRGGEARDGRINRAIAIASSRGRVLDAGQQSGSVFWVRVATDRGRVDLLVDVNSGRIIGER